MTVLDPSRAREARLPSSRRWTADSGTVAPRSWPAARLLWSALRACLADAAVALVAVEVVTLLAWAADGKSRSAPASALRLGACFWLAALHTRIHVGAAVVGIPPLGLTLVVGWLAGRSAGHLGRGAGRSTARGWPLVAELSPCVAAFALCSGAVAALVAVAVDTATLHPSPATAGLGGAAVGGSGALFGLFRRRTRSGQDTLRSMLPEPAQVALAAASTALVALCVVGAVLSGVLLVAHHTLAAALNHALSPGPLGTGALDVLQVAVSPLLVVGAVAWLAGPGFAVGSHTSVTPWATHLGPVPAMPLLAALPSGTHHLGTAVLAVPVAAGVLMGVVVLRRHPSSTWWHPHAIVAAAAAFAGMVSCLGAYAAGGPAGPGRLLTVGPSGWRLGSALCGELLVGATAIIAANRLWLLRSVAGVNARRAAAGVRVHLARPRAPLG